MCIRMRLSKNPSATLEKHLLCLWQSFTANYAHTYMYEKIHLGDCILKDPQTQNDIYEKVEIKDCSVA